MGDAPDFARARATVPFSISLNPWVVAPVTLVCAVFAVPYLLTHDFGVAGVALQQGFAAICHQRPERSFWIFGAPVAVCARCLGIYVGAAIGLLLRTSRQIALRLLMAAAAMNLLDMITESASLHSNWMGVRFGIGVVLGTAGALLISSSLLLRPEPSFHGSH